MPQIRKPNLKMDICLFIFIAIFFSIIYQFFPINMGGDNTVSQVEKHD